MVHIAKVLNFKVKFVSQEVVSAALSAQKFSD